jgi:hypothetical protein
MYALATSLPRFCWSTAEATRDGSIRRHEALSVSASPLGGSNFVQLGGDAESPVSGSALFYFGPDTEVFEAKFGVLGLVYREPAFGAGRNDA